LVSTDGVEAPQSRWKKYLEKSRIELVEEALQIPFNPTFDDLQACREPGAKLAEIAKVNQTIH